MKTIIATTDYSSDAQYAVNYAAKLAACFQAKLVLFNAFQLPIYASNAIVSPGAIDEIMLSNEIRLAGLAGKLAEIHDIEVEPVTYMTIVSEALEDLVDQCDADLVVMGMRNDFIEYKLLGNTTTAVIKKASFPVLVVPYGADFHQIERILFARDRQALQGSNSVRLLKEVAALFKAEVQVLHVDRMLDQLPVDAAANAVDYDVEDILHGSSHAYKQVKADSVASGIMQEIEDYKPDLLVMIPHKASFPDNLLKRSMTRKMVMKTRIPLLALPDVKEAVLDQENVL